MKKEQLLVLAALLVAYYYFVAKRGPATARNGGLNLSTGRNKRKTGLAPSTFGSSASTKQYGGRRMPFPLVNPAQGNGTGVVSSPVRSIAALNAPTRRNIGTAVRSRTLSRAWSGTGSAFVAPTWPTRAYRSNGTSVRTGSGLVNVPSYTAVPTVTRGPGGVGSAIWLGGRS